MKGNFSQPKKKGSPEHTTTSSGARGLEQIDEGGGGEPERDDGKFYNDIYFDSSDDEEGN